MRVILYVGKPGDLALAKSLVEFLAKRGIEVLGARDSEARGLGIVAWDPGTNGDVAIVLGGDGAVLRSLQELGLGLRMPILHVGTGRVNFLSDCGGDCLEEVLTKLLRGDYVIERRALLEAEGRGSCTVLNEVLVRGLNPGRLTTITVAEVGGEVILSARMDGVIVATPTGSTAYALAANGPVLDIRVGAKLIVPLAPFSRALAPIVHPLDAPLAISSTEDAVVVCDGSRSWIDREVTVRRSGKEAMFIRTRGYRFYERVWRRLFMP